MGRGIKSALEIKTSKKIDNLTSEFFKLLLKMFCEVKDYPKNVIPVICI